MEVGWGCNSGAEQGGVLINFQGGCHQQSLKFAEYKESLIGFGLGVGVGCTLRELSKGKCHRVWIGGWVGVQQCSGREGCLD